MNRFVGMAIVLCCVAVGCGEPAESESLKEARKLHDQLIRISEDLHEAVQASLVRIEEEIEASMSAGDSTLSIQLARLESQLGELDVRFHDWESTVVGIPGDTCDHDHDHDHDHDDAHDHGHDHAHDHGNELSLEGMSDEEIREIQAALLAELESLQAAYDAIQAKLNGGEASE
jgi:ABC-type nickel/cobalt efflux system permease component RcnA